MKGLRIIALLFFTILLFINSAGCGNKFFDPTQVGRFRPTPAVNVILDSLGVAEEAPLAWENAEEPKPSDIIAVDTDYVLQSGDVIRVTIFELFQEGRAVVNDYVITESGKISVPDVGVIQAAGLTETQLEDEIRQILSPSILKEPSVTVALLGSQQRTFSVLGEGVPRPGRYTIPRHDFRLTDALATAGGSRQFNVSYIYVSRIEKGKEKAIESVEPEADRTQINELETIEPEFLKSMFPELKDIDREFPEQGLINEKGYEPEEPSQQIELEREMLDIISPMAKYKWPKSEKVIIASTEMRSKKEPDRVILPSSFELLNKRKQNSNGEQNVLTSVELTYPEQINKRNSGNEIDHGIEWIFENGTWVPVRTDPQGAIKTELVAAVDEANEQVEWIFKDGKWVPVKTGPPTTEKAPIKFKPVEPVVPLEEKLPEELEWEEAIKTRLIRIPVDKLLAGDPRYNIVVKPKDSIFVPVDIVGEFCIMGNVNRSGYINITGRPMTLKMAIAAAGGLGPLAWPKKCEVVRRIGRKKEEIVMVDLDKIARGEQPDFFIKPHDLINVGTHPTSRWRAILRNAFRATYGFGFIYDRNFAYKDYWGYTYNPITPWKWSNVF